MPGLVYLDSALADLLSILEHITRETGSINLARATTDRIQARCSRLAALPGTLGRPRDELGPGIRSFAVKNHVIFFRYTQATLEIINILHGHRDIISHFTPTPDTSTD